MSDIEIKLLERMQQRRMRRAAIHTLRKIGGSDAARIENSEEMIAAFVDECLAIQHGSMGGPIGDAIQALIQSFIDDPQKWISVISLIIKMFP